MARTYRLILFATGSCSVETKQLCFAGSQSSVIAEDELLSRRKSGSQRGRPFQRSFIVPNFFATFNQNTRNGTAQGSETHGNRGSRRGKRVSAEKEGAGQRQRAGGRCAHQKSHQEPQQGTSRKLDLYFASFLSSFLSPQMAS